MHTDREGPGDGPVAGAHEYAYGDPAPGAEVPFPTAGPSPTPPSGPSDPEPLDATAEPSTPRTPTDPSPTEPLPASAPPAEGAAAEGAPSMGTTTPRALLRPIPEGFPTPPPRLPGPRRRPDRRPEPEPTPRRGRGPLLGAIVLGAVALLVLGVGGLVLAVRGLGGQEGPVAAPSPGAGTEAPADGEPADADTAGEVTINGVRITEVSTEVGVRHVGNGSLAREPEGEFVIVTIEVENPTDAAVDVLGEARLEAADGALVERDREAGQLHIADSQPFGFTTSGETKTFHMIFDVPIGADPTSLHLSVHGEDGALPLGG